MRAPPVVRIDRRTSSRAARVEFGPLAQIARHLSAQGAPIGRQTGIWNFGQIGVEVARSFRRQIPLGREALRFPYIFRRES